MAEFEKIAFVASETRDAEDAYAALVKRYGNAPTEEADAIVALGGDGLMLQTMHSHLHSGIPIYGMNRGSVGFLLNDYKENRLKERLAAAEITVIHPLRMKVRDEQGQTHEALAINEVSLFRQIHQAAKFRIGVDGTTRMGELICDGVLVSTPAGSHRLQSIRSRTHFANHCTTLGSYAHQSFSAPTVAWSAAAK